MKISFSAVNTPLLSKSRKNLKSFPRFMAKFCVDFKSISQEIAKIPKDLQEPEEHFKKFIQ